MIVIGEKKRCQHPKKMKFYIVIQGFFRFWFVDGKIRVNFTKTHEDDENNHKNTLLENQEKSVVL